MAQNEIIWPGPIVIERNRWLSLSEPVAALPPGHGANPSAEPIKFVILNAPWFRKTRFLNLIKGHEGSRAHSLPVNPLAEPVEAICA